MDIVFDGPPSPEGATFVEIDIGGRSIRVGGWAEGGEWVDRGDGTHAIRFTPEALEAAAELTRIAHRNLAASRSAGDER